MDYEEKKKIVREIIDLIDSNNLMCDLDRILSKSCEVMRCSECRSINEDYMLSLIRSDADRFVEAHGGLEAVKGKFASDSAMELFRGAIKTRDELEKEIQELKEEKAEIIHTDIEFIDNLMEAVGIYEKSISKAKARIFEELDKRLMPKGMEWPKFEDGKPVKFFDHFYTESIDDVPVTTIGFSHNGVVIINPMSYSEEERIYVVQHDRVKRPEKNVLDADGVKIKKGDTVYCIATDGQLLGMGISPSKENKDRLSGGLTVSSFTDTPWVMFDEVTLRIDPKCLTHKEPRKVLDADGVEIKIGDKLYMVDDDAWKRNAISKDSEREPFTVTATHADVFNRIRANSADEEEGTDPWWINPETMTHKQPDSWEKLEKDACKDLCEYFGFKGKPCNGCPAEESHSCSVKMTKDLVKRAKALSEKDHE